MSDVDKETYAPLILMTGQFESLFMSDSHMVKHESIFEELSEEGWTGGGYDWTSLARVLVSEKLPEIESTIKYDPEAGMFSASGPVDNLKKLGTAMQELYNDEDMIRDLLSRAELDD